MDNMGLKLSLKLCQSFEDFDTILSQTWCKTDEDKISYLKELFDIDIVHATDNDKHIDYIAMANAIMNHS